MSHTYPVVLCFSGHDPSGGAGIQADIETLASHRCHAASVVTVLTDQDSCNVKQLFPQTPERIIQQAHTVLTDMEVQLIKIGLIGHPDIASAIGTILQEQPDIPVVLDPILAAGGGTDFSSAELIAAIDTLLPYVSVLTPNSQEARLLSGKTELDDCGLGLLNKGCDYVLITGTHESTPEVINRVYHQQKMLESFAWDRLPFSYHGSGCTLASSIAGSMAHGLEPFSAIAEAQDFTWNALAVAYKVGQGQHNPKRFFWMD